MDFGNQLNLNTKKFITHAECQIAKKEYGYGYDSVR